MSIALQSHVRELVNAVEQDAALREAAAAFERDMKPVCNAVVGALKAGDVKALQGLRALLPHLLEEVNQSPELADLLAHQLGKSLVQGLTSKPGDVE